MRLCFFIAALVMGQCLSAQQWSPWRVTASFTKDAEGYESFRCLKGEDSTGALWQITWDPTGVFVTAPDGSRKTLGKAFPVEAHPHGGMSISNSDIERWYHQDWECLRLRINTGRNGIGMDYYLVVVVDRKSRDWAVCSGRVSDESIEGPFLNGETLLLRWCDEEDRRPLRVKHEWSAARVAAGIRISTSPEVYQLEYGYPYWFRFWSDVTSPNPDVAEHKGWLSVAWRLEAFDNTGGTATSAQTAIPKAPGKQVWQKGTGPDIWFPVQGTLKFKWDREVQIRRYALPAETVTPAVARELAAGRGWDVILTRNGSGDFLGSMLVERAFPAEPTIRPR